MKVVAALKNKVASPLIVFSLIIFLISLHDGIMSYITPVILNYHLKDTFIVGLILSTSSTFGMLFNFVIAEFYDHKTYRFFISRMLFFAISFPLIFLIFPRKIVSFIIAMIIWSVYYEFRNYSKYDFVHKFLPNDKNTESWATMSIFQSTAYMLGPIITLYLLERKMNLPLYASILVTLIAIFFYLLFLGGGKNKSEEKKEENIRSFFTELKIMRVLMKKIWPLILFCFALTLLDVSFWTTGVLYSEVLKEQSNIGGLLIIMYCLPSIFVGIITPRIYQNLGKKRTAFVTGLAASIGLITVGLSKNIFLTLGLVFLTATFADIAFILIFATFEDYVTRLDAEGEGNDLVSVGQLAQNFSYSVGPVTLGIVSKGGNFGNSFILSGVVLFLASMIAIAVVPRKIRMPHKELAEELK